MKKTQSLIITCAHSNVNEIYKTEDGEFVCKCGVVLEEKTLDQSGTTSQNNTTLYHHAEIGGAPTDMKVINKNIHIPSSPTSQFSDICEKINLPSFLQIDAWEMYCNLRENTHHTRAKCAALSLYVTCRKNDQAVSEFQIQNAIRTFLNVKNVPNMLNVISELHYDALKIGIDTNEGCSPNYYLNLLLKKNQDKFSETDYNKFKINAIKNFGCLTGNNQNKAKRAIRMAFFEMEVDLK